MRVEGSERSPGLTPKPGIARPGALCVAAVLTLLALEGCRGSEERAEALDPAVLQAAVGELLTRSEEAWNGGDLAGFVDWYRRGPETTFLGSAGLTHGWEAIRERYADRFAPGATRDSLRFEDLETRPLAPNLGLATARYVLFQGDSVMATGVFTLIVQRTPEGWRIIHDQSS